MKRNDMKTYLVRYTMPTAGERALAAMDDAVNDGKLPPWDPEESEGFDEWYEGATLPPGMREKCLAAWNACLSRQEAQQRTIEPKEDPEVLRKDIEAHVTLWAKEFNPAAYRFGMSLTHLEGAGRALLHRLGVL